MCNACFFSCCALDISEGCGCARVVIQVAMVVSTAEKCLATGNVWRKIMNNLSPKEAAILKSLKAQGLRRLPDGTKISSKDPLEKRIMIGWTSYLERSCYWQWSWTISQEAMTADYRRRITELNNKGYEIISFHAPLPNGAKRRHGYILVREPETVPQAHHKKVEEQMGLL